MAYKTFYGRIPVRLHNLLKELTQPRGGREFARHFLPKFLSAKPWGGYQDWFPAKIPDTKTVAGITVGIVQMNIELPDVLAQELDRALKDAGVSKASFLLGALLWVVHENFPGTRPVVLEISREMNFLPLAAPEALIRGEVKQKPEIEKKATRDWRDESQDRYGAPCGAGNSTEIRRILATEQRDGATNSLFEGDILRAAQEFADTLKPFGKDADGARTLVFPPSLAASQVLRERGTVAVLAMDAGAAKLVQCYRANLRSGEKARQLYLPPRVSARRGQQEAQAAALSETKHLGHLKTKFAYEPMAFWIGYLLEAVLAERMTAERASKAVFYYSERSVRNDEDFRVFCKNHLPAMLNGFRPIANLEGSTKELFQQLCGEIQRFYGDRAWSIFQPSNQTQQRI